MGQPLTNRSNQTQNYYHWVTGFNMEMLNTYLGASAERLVIGGPFRGPVFFRKTVQTPLKTEGEAKGDGGQMTTQGHESRKGEIVEHVPLASGERPEKECPMHPSTGGSVSLCDSALRLALLYIDKVS